MFESNRVDRLYRYQVTNNSSIAAAVFLVLDIVLAPYIFTLIWNATIHDIFTSVPTLHYYQAFLFKLALMFYFKDTFCSHYAYTTAHDAYEYYINCLVKTIKDSNGDNRAFQMTHIPPNRTTGENMA